MRSSAVIHLNNMSRSPDRHRDRDDTDQGFTLVELLIVITIMPLIIGALSLGLISIFGLQNSVTNRIADTADAQVVSSTFLQDVQSAIMITTQSSSTPQCGNGTQLLGLEWNGTSANGFQTVVSYDSVPVTNGSTTTYSLVRKYCTFGNLTPVSTVTVSYDIAAPGTQLPPCYTVVTTCNSSNDTRTSSFIPAKGVPVVTLVVNELKSPFSYTLVGTPRAWSGGPAGGTFPTAPLRLYGTGCNDLTLLNNATLSINVAGGTNNGQVALASTCPGSASIANGAVLGVSSIITADPTLDTATGGGTYPSTEYYEAAYPDPLAALVAPTLAVTAVSCLKTGSLYTCPPGYYATDPGFVNGSTVTFTGGGTYTFNADFNLPNGTAATFDTGTYIFNGSGTAISTGTNGITITGNSVLFYIPNGSVNFDNNASITLTSQSLYDGVSIWDSFAGATVQLANNTSEVNSYGGVYVPLGTVATNNNGTMAVGFISASLADFTQNTSINITTQ